MSATDEDPPQEVIDAAKKALDGDTAGRNIEPPDPTWCYGCAKPKSECGH